jgi:hypothetical protein
MPVKIKNTNSMFNDEFKKELNGASEYYFFPQKNLEQISGSETLSIRIYSKRQIVITKYQTTIFLKFLIIFPSTSSSPSSKN